MIHGPYNIKLIIKSSFILCSSPLFDEELLLNARISSQYLRDYMAFVFQSAACGFGSAKFIDLQSSNLLLIHTEQKESLIADFAFVFYYVRVPRSTGCHQAAVNAFTVLS